MKLQIHVGHVRPPKEKAAYKKPYLLWSHNQTFLRQTLKLLPDYYYAHI